MRILDLGSNPWLGPSDVLNLLQCFRNQTSSMKSGERLQPNLTDLNVKDTNLSREAALFLCEILSQNTKICRVNLEFNSSVSANILADITKACKRNRDILKQTRLPKAQKELDRLLSLTANGEECTYEKRTAYQAEIEQI